MEVPGGRLAVERFTAGTEPVLTIHGVSSQRRLWNWLQAADPGLSLVAPDLRGYGESVAVGDALDALVTVRPVPGVDHAALISRSCRVPHDGHVQCRVSKLSSARRYPHAEHVFDDGNHRSITITRPRTGPPCTPAFPGRCPPAVRDRLRHPAVAGHVLDGEVFQDDQVMVPDQAGAGLVEEVGARGADLPVGPGRFGLGLARLQSRAGSGPCAAGTGPGSGPAVQGVAGWRSAARRW